ncbi:MAG TPA: FtsX-like permease family protein, partial [Xanthomonadales bacterium]|nr:FtsX-like permease family protein [Xanthomonadales bacterium]
ALAKARRNEMKREDGTQEPLVKVVSANAASVDPYGTEGAHRKSWLLLGCVFAVLVIACLDVMGLLLVRREERRAELAVRLGIGAGPARLVRQLLLEGLVLAFAGAVVGAVLARVLLDVAVALAPTTFAIPLGIAQGVLSPRVLGAVLGATLFSCVLAALAPALGVRRMDVSAAMRTQSQSVVGARMRPGATLLAVQIAASFVMLCLALLLLRSFIAEASVKPGFEPANVVVGSVDRALQGYDKVRGRAFEGQVLEALRADPAVESAANAFSVPVWPSGLRSSISAESAGLAVEQMPHADLDAVSPGYFAAMRIPLVAGREFDARDTAESTPVAIVSQALAQQLFPNGDAIGSRLAGGRDEKYEIVGIASDVAVRSLRDPHVAAFYRPTTQMYLSPTTFVARLKPGVGGDPAAVLRRAVAAVDATLPVNGVRTLEEQIGRTMGEARLVTTALGAFAAIAVVLSLAGIYGLFAYFVRSRQREIGLRLALGADARRILALVAGQGAMVVVAGLSLGFAGAVVATRTLEAMLYGVGARDAGTFALAAALLGFVAIAAVLVPARQAARIDPQRSLRAE